MQVKQVLGLAILLSLELHLQLRRVALPVD
jgi:hypothetical protein